MTNDESLRRLDLLYDEHSCLDCDRRRKCIHVGTLCLDWKEPTSIEEIMRVLDQIKRDSMEDNRVKVITIDSLSGLPEVSNEF